MSRLERYPLERRVKVPFAGSLRGDHIADANKMVPEPQSPIQEQQEKPQLERPAIFPYETGEGQK